METRVDHELLLIAYINPLYMALHHVFLRRFLLF